MINVAGIDPATHDLSPVGIHKSMQWEGKRCCAVTQGRLMQPGETGVAVVDKSYALKAKVTVGQVIQLPEESFRIVGVADFHDFPRAAQAEVFIPLTDAQRLVGQGEIVNLVLVKVKNLAERQQVAKVVKKIVVRATHMPPDSVKVLMPETILSDTTGVAALTQLTMKALALVMLVGISLLVVKVTLSSVSERTREIGIMKATGWETGTVSRLITLESAIQALVGGVLGVVIGYGVAFLYAATTQMKLPHGLAPYSCVPAAAPPSNLVVAMRLSPGLVVLALAVALGIGIVSGYIAAQRQARFEPAEALRRL